MDNITLLHGDCLELMKNIPDNSADMILCDLPYGTTACKWDSVLPFDKLWEQYERISKDNTAILLFGNEPFSSNLRLSNIKNYRYDWIWKKSRPVGFLNAKKQPMRNVENISSFYKKQPVYNPQELIKIDRQMKNVLSKQKKTEIGISTHNGGRLSENYVQEFENYPSQLLSFASENKFHPTQKPVSLLEYLIKTYTNEDDTVLDNCMGSGSTGIACLNTNRKFIGMELDDKYFEIAKNRIENHKLDTQLKLF